jgi:hypothetical protein
MAQIAISSFVLCIALYLIARHEAEISLPVILIITLCVGMISLLLSLAIGPFAFLVSLFVLAYAIQRFCYIGWPKAWAVTGVYAVTNISLALVHVMLRR